MNAVCMDVCVLGGVSLCVCLCALDCSQEDEQLRPPYSRDRGQLSQLWVSVPLKQFKPPPPRVAEDTSIPRHDEFVTVSLADNRSTKPLVCLVEFHCSEKQTHIETGSVRQCTLNVENPMICYSGKALPQICV